jgi:hypothetical protein
VLKHLDVAQMQAVGAHGVTVEEKKVAVLHEKVAQMQVGVAEAGFAEVVDKGANLFGEMAMLGERAAGLLLLSEVMIELNGGFDGVKNDDVAESAVERESEHDGDGAGSGNVRFLQSLQAREFSHGGAAAEESAEAVAWAALGIEFQKIGFAGVLEAPDLAIAAVFDELADLWQIAKGGFQISRHS